MHPEDPQEKKPRVSIRAALGVALGFVYDAVLEKLQERRERKEDSRRRPPEHW